MKNFLVLYLPGTLALFFEIFFLVSSEVVASEVEVAGFVIRGPDSLCIISVTTFWTTTSCVFESDLTSKVDICLGLVILAPLGFIFSMCKWIISICECYIKRMIY